eukprot:CAMPEP_0198257710 /NCGR_PEP_ID=MMETSP1447-20131203/7307_1 /TAXON_ID=420782 /ORGANISM="Chaetoceros dichaeta, Strain CCMP1751" /LENGTH=479 /DNA_ID=CAMNT_0043944671 /DNA_START=87 /DNA_END=1523 /DNA_ORIENTATION=+
MSAYALQGSFLFLPPSASTTIDLPKTNITTTTKSTNSTNSTTWNDSHIHKSKSDSALPNSISTTITTNDGEPTDDNGCWYSKNGLFISIKTATIDPIRLIQFIGARSRASRTPMQQNNNHNNNNNNSLVSSSSNTNNGSLRHRFNTLSNTLTGGRAGAASVSSASSSTAADCDESWSEYDEMPTHTPNSTGQHRSSYSSSSSSDSSPSSVVVTDHRRNNNRTNQTEGLHVSNEPTDTHHHHHHQENFHDGDNGPITPPSTPLQTPGIIHNKAKTNRSSNTTTKNHDDNALRFNIGITFNGRKYTATRALPSFVKLRQDLMQEISKQGTNTDSTAIPSNQHHNRNHYTHHTTTTTTTPTTNDNDDDYDEDFLIPDLPFGNKHRSSSSNKDGILDELVAFAGRGFSRLEAALCSYCPEMEKWLRAVAVIVPMSPSLANFLWEPIEGDVRGENCFLNSRSSSSSNGNGNGNGRGQGRSPSGG